MRKEIVSLVALSLGILGHADSAAAQDSKRARSSEVVIWTATIPEGFPHNVYTWRLRRDGTYQEDGRDVSSGKPIQGTLTGRWTVDGTRMILRQDWIPYVFDGVVLGESYAGTLYLADRKVSRFCAAKGEVLPEQCDPAVQAWAR